jgi:hypothetical protein
LRPKVTPVGDTVMDSRTAAVTFRSVLPDTPEYVAVTVLVPTARTVAKPGVVVLMDATLDVPLAVTAVQVAPVVTIAVVLSA